MKARQRKKRRRRGSNRRPAYRTTHHRWAALYCCERGREQGPLSPSPPRRGSLAPPCAGIRDDPPDLADDIRQVEPGGHGRPDLVTIIIRIRSRLRSTNFAAPRKNFVDPRRRLPHRHLASGVDRRPVAHENLDLFDRAQSVFPALHVV